MRIQVKTAIKKIKPINKLNRFYWKLVTIATERFYKDMLNPKIAKRYLDFLFFKKNDYQGVVLEVGCAYGCNIFALNKMGIKAYGFDLKAYLELWDLMKDKFLIASTYQIPFGNNIFDKIFCLAVLEHLSDDDLALKEIYRVLKNDGEAIFMVPNILSSKNNVDKSHLREYTIEQIIDKLRRNNFSIARVKTRYAYSPFFTAQLNSFLSLIGLFGFKYHWNFFNFVSKLMPEHKKAHIYINAFKTKVANRHEAGFKELLQDC